MDEKYQAYKKSKQYKKQVIMNLFLLLLFVAIVFVFYQFYIKYNSNTPNVNKNYFYEINNNEVFLYSSDGLLNSYKCQNECVIYQGKRSDGYFYQGRIMLQDGEVIYLYDLLNNKKLSGNFTAVDFILDGEGNALTNIKLFLVMNDTNKYGIMNLNGTLQVNLNYEALGNFDQNEELMNYSYANNYITAKANDKWGLISLDNGKGLIDQQYEDIRLSSYHKFMVKDQGLWYLVTESNIKLLNEGYEYLDVYENYLVVVMNNQVFITDLAGNIVSDKKDLSLPIDPWLFNSAANGLYTALENDQINLYIGDQNGLKTKYIYNADQQKIVNQTTE